MRFAMKEFGLRLTKLRIERGYTQERLATALNMDRTHISKLESGTRACSIDAVIQFSAFFGVSLDYLVLGKKENRDSDELYDELGEIIYQLSQFREKI